MPVIKSAKKKLRQDRHQEIQNIGIKNLLKSHIKIAKAEKTEKAVINAVKITDKAAKKNIIHKNKAARIKSVLSKLLVKTQKTKTEKPSPASKTHTSAAA